MPLRIARGGVLNNGMPRMTARATVAPGDCRVAAKHLLHSNVMLRPAIRTQMGDTRVLDLSRKDLV